MGHPRVLISVVIPSYNTAATVERAIASVVAAAGERWSAEVVVVDDGSTDASLDVLHDCARRWPAVRVLTHPGGRNRGISATRNLALREARGTYVAFVDADDDFLPNRFETCLPLLESDASIEAVVEPYELVHVGGERSEAMRGAGTAEAADDEDPATMFERGVREGRLPHTSSITLRRDVLDQVGLFPEHLRYCLEKPLWLKVYSRGRVRTGAREPVARYYLHDASTCARHEASALFRFEDIAAHIDVFRWLKRTGGPHTMRDLLERRIAGKYFDYCRYARTLQHDFVRDCVRHPASLAWSVPSLALTARYWKATLHMCLHRNGTLLER